MGNPNYRKGANYERKIVNEARDQGLIAFRSAGSHSPIDVCVIDLKNTTIKFFQCKAGSQESIKVKLNEKYGNDFNKLFSVSFEAI